MKKILSIQSSPQGKASVSRRLSDGIVSKLIAANPSSTVEILDLVKHPFPHLEEVHIGGFYTPEEQRSELHKTAIRHSDETIKAVMEADILVIGAPMHNFSIPSTLKAWIDHLVRRGVTFSYSDKGPVGLIKGKKVYVAIASAGIYSEGMLKSMDFVEPYLRMILGFIGLTDVTVVRAEGMSMGVTPEAALEKGLAGLQVG
jgi:FMN-dependent NADH-azoreductase